MSQVDRSEILRSGEQQKSRRDFLKSLSIGATASLLFGIDARGEKPTPSQTEGPFYPNLDNDLTIVRGATERAKGDVIYVHGIVRNTEGEAAPRALVEIWQTDSNGIYWHPGDPQHPNKDPNFQSYGRCVTDREGGYIFKTIRPRWYADGGMERTPHIHFKIWREGYLFLTTQMYFAGEVRNENDSVRRGLTDEELERVTIEFQPIDKISNEVEKALRNEFRENTLTKGAHAGQFNLVIEPV
jgi:protocatechuate 3,4-dioxygenase beta subunit